MIIGLTGNIFSGKSAVAEIFKSKGAVLIDADKISHSVLNKEQNRITRLFGRRLNRKEIAKIVFRDNKKLKQLCNILHGPIIRQINKKISLIKKSKSKRFVIVDAPLLIESGLYKTMDKNIVVTCPKNLLIKRAQNKGVSRNEVLTRLKCQLPEEKKKKYADFIILNNKNKADLNQKVTEVLKKLR